MLTIPGDVSVNHLSYVFMIPGAHITGKAQGLFPGIREKTPGSLPGLLADFYGFSVGAVFRNLLTSLTNGCYSIVLSLPGLVIGIRIAIRANIPELNIIRTAAFYDKFGL